MDLLREAKGAWRLGQDALRIVVWIAATTWLGGRALWRIGLVTIRLRQALGTTIRCPRHHAVPLYGVHRCGSCHASIEGYIFRRCRFCGSVPSWTPCPKCRLGVGDPLQ